MLMFLLSDRAAIDDSLITNTSTEVLSYPEWELSNWISEGYENFKVDIAAAAPTACHLILFFSIICSSPLFQNMWPGEQNSIKQSGMIKFCSENNTQLILLKNNHLLQCNFVY